MYATLGLKNFRHAYIFKLRCLCRLALWVFLPKQSSDGLQVAIQVQFGTVPPHATQMFSFR
jgi:hypothetical protein